MHATVLAPVVADAGGDGRRFRDRLRHDHRVPDYPLLRRVWELRQNLTAYDRCYVALAEAVDRPLLTADRHLTNAPGLRCDVEVLQTPGQP